MRVGVLGATGYAGLEVLRLAASHEDLEIVLATGDSNAGKTVAEHAPALASVYPDLSFATTEAVFEHELEVVFLALPHGASQPYQRFSNAVCRWSTWARTFD